MRPAESVWDYPRPPRVEPCDRRVRVEFAGEQIAESERALRVLETASPPTIYVPADDVRTDLLEEVGGRHTVCEWKGRADYHHVEVGGTRADAAAWSYRDPRPGFEQLRDHFAFYASRVDACFLDDERVEPQASHFYGGWITAEIEGPFKGEAGSEGW